MHPHVLRICAALTLAGTSARADHRTLTEYSSGSEAKNRVLQLQKDNLHRTETNSRHAFIRRPEAMIFLDLENKTFTRTVVTPSHAAASSGTPSNTGAPSEPGQPRKGGIVISRMAIEDTGERKQIFGYEARHLKMRTETIAGPDTCHPGEMRMETDGWYIDLKLQRGTGQADGGPSAPSANSGCKDEYKSEYTGSGKPGFPIDYTAKIWHNGQGPNVMSMKVLELSEEPLSAALFEVPEGFTDKATAARTHPSNAADKVTSTDSKSGGTIRVGVAPVVNAPSGSHATLAAQLNGESIPSITLTDSALETARAANAQYLLKAEQVAKEEKKRGSMFGKLSKALGGKEIELRYTLIAVADGRELLTSSAVSKAGGAGLGAALGIAQAAVPAVGAGRGGYVAQTVVNSAANTLTSGNFSGLPIAGLFGSHSYAAYSGMMDPNLQSLAYMSRYSPSMAGAQAAGMAVSAAASGANRTEQASVEAAPEGTLNEAMQQAARAVASRLRHEP